MNSLWDTTIPVFEYPDNFRRVYDKIYVSQRKNFSDWIGKISRAFANDLDWWSSSVSSRHTYISKLFHNICIIETLHYLNRKRKFPDEVVVSSLQLKKTIDFYFKAKKIKVKKDNSFFYWIKKIYFIFWPLTFAIIIIFLSRIFKGDNLNLKKNNNVLIDIFVTTENLTTERFYNNLEKKKLNNKKNIYFVPTILNVHILKLPKLIKQIRKNKNFILKEDFINFSDVSYAFNYFFRKRKFYTNYANYKIWNLSNLVKEEFSIYSNFQAILISILNYRFAKNLSSKSIKLKKVVDWFENTTVDKGWNLGFRKFFPNTITVGYQSYTLYRQFMCKHPSKAEHLNKVIPSEIVVIGKAYKKIRKEFCKKIKVSVGPALRFDHLFSQKFNTRRKRNILITLNLDLTESKKILTSIIDTKYGQSGKIIFIKPHPLLPLSKIINKNLIPKNFVELKGDFFKIAKNTKIIISAGISSSILEGFACGCAIIMPNINKNDHYNFEYLKIPKTSYKICKNTNELDEKINHFLNEKEKNIKKRIIKSNLLKTNLFEKTSKRNLQLFS